jgi:hypothetical protein
MRFAGQGQIFAGRREGGAATLATQSGASYSAFGLKGDVSVQVRVSIGCVVGAMAVAVALCGCGNVDDNKDAWFAKPFQFVSRNGGYSFSELQETKDRTKVITAGDLVDNNGACPAQLAPAAQPAAPAQPAPAAAGGNQAGAPPASDANSLLGGGVALGMSECDVVNRAGAPNSVQIGNNPNGDRTAVLTFNAGPRAGIYHFERGALMEIEGVPAPPAPPKVAKKKPANPAKQKQAATN